MVDRFRFTLLIGHPVATEPACEVVDFYSTFKRAKRAAEKLPKGTRYWIQEKGSIVYTVKAQVPPGTGESLESYLGI